MFFNSVEFLIFLPVVLGVYYVLSRRAQNAWLVPVHSVYPCTLRRLLDGTHPAPLGARLIAETVFSSLSR